MTEQHPRTVPMTEDERAAAARDAQRGIARAAAASNPMERIFWAELARIAAAKSRAGVHVVCDAPLSAAQDEDD